MSGEEKRRKRIGIVLLILLAGVLAVLAVEIGKLRDVDRTYGEIVRRLGSPEELPQKQADNPEVIAWLTVDGTAVSVPVTQAQDNVRYLNTDVNGDPSFAGNPFLDYRNSADFSDVYSVIYGHHMEEHLMFGDLDLCMEPAFWEGPCTGKLELTDGRQMAIRFFAAVRADGNDRRYFDPRYAASNWDADFREALTDGTAFAQERIAADDRVLALSTCEEANSDRRIILLGKMTENR